jgi:hypothetical protein
MTGNFIIKEKKKNKYIINYTYIHHAIHYIITLHQKNYETNDIVSCLIFKLNLLFFLYNFNEIDELDC